MAWFGVLFPVFFFERDRFMMGVIVFFMVLLGLTILGLLRRFLGFWKSNPSALGCLVYSKD